MREEIKTKAEELKNISRNGFILVEKEVRAALKIVRRTINNKESSYFRKDEMENIDLKKYVHWGKEYLGKIKRDDNNELKNIKESTLSLLLSLGVSDVLLTETLAKNKVEIFEQLLGEAVSVFALAFAWKEEDKVMFSQALGQIGVAGIYAASPITGIIALVGLAMGYNRMFHAEALKKGGVISLVGLGVATVVPGGLVVSFLAALIAVVKVNQYLKVDRPIEEQIREAFEKVKAKFNLNTQ